MPTPYVYVTDSAAVRTQYAIPQLLNRLPQSMHQRALRYRREEDAYNFILGRLLLQEGLADLQIAETIADLQFEQSGKPFLASVGFNLSHSANKVVCAISKKGHIGIDIEKKKAVELTPFESWFTVAEWKAIHASAVPLDRFYGYWTRKESIIKALGLTLSHLNQIALDLNQDIFEDKGTQWYIQDVNVGAGFVGAICTDVRPALPIEVKHLDF